MSGKTNTQLMYSEEYSEFARLVKKHVVYNLVLRVLPGDISTIIGALPRLGKSYANILVGIQKDIGNELGKVRICMREMDGKIVEEKQEEFVRILKSNFKGNDYTHQFRNYVLLHECEDTVKSFIQGNQPLFTTDW